MAKQLKLRRGTTTEHSTFTGAEGEVTVDTTKDTVVVHDGATAGGVPLAKESAIPTGALASKDTVATADIDADAINGTKIADNSIDSEHYVDGSIDSVHLAADVIDGTKIADNAINSEHYVDGSIDRVHLAADVIDGTKIADDVINSEHYVAGSIDAEHLATDSVTAAKIAANAVGASELNVTGNGTSGQLLSSDGDGTMTWTTIASGATLKVQRFHSPGTWTKPANTNHVKVTVVGGGGGGSPGQGQPGNPTSGGSSSFGSIASANGGAAMQKNSAPVSNIASGNGSVSSGTVIGLGQVPNSGQPLSTQTQAADFTYGIGVSSYSNFSGLGRTSGSPNSFTSSNTKPAANFNKVLPGAGCMNSGVGGYACSYAPVSGPVSVTVGVGGNPNYDPANQKHGKSGVVVVEWVE